MFLFLLLSFGKSRFHFFFFHTATNFSPRGCENFYARAGDEDSWVRGGLSLSSFAFLFHVNVSASKCMGL